MDKDQKPIIDAMLETEFKKIVQKTLINYIKHYQNCELSRRDFMHIFDEVNKQRDVFAETILKRFGLDNHYDSTYYHDYLSEMFRKNILETKDMISTVNFKELH